VYGVPKRGPFLSANEAYLLNEMSIVSIGKTSEINYLNYL
jgi:hypothetical protein